MKNKLFSVLSIMFLIMLTVSCEHNDQSDSSIAQTWKAQKVVLITADGGASERSIDTDEQITFNEDGSWNYLSGAIAGDSAGSGYYLTEEGIIRINNRDEIAYNISGNEMTWTGTIASGIYEIVWQKQ